MLQPYSLHEKQEDVLIDKARNYSASLFTFMKQGTTGTNSGPTQRVFTGTVTKFHENFGFVDEDVFFQTSVVKGQTPRVNVCTNNTNQSVSLANDIAGVYDEAAALLNSPRRPATHC